MVRTLIIIVLLAAGVYGAFWGFLYYRTMQFMDDLVVQAEPHGELVYGAISPDVTGSISVADIRFQPYGAEDVVRFDRISLVGPDALFFVQLLEGVDLQRGQLPERFNVRIDRLSVDLAGDIMRRLQPGGGETADVDACQAGASGLDTELLRRLGLDTLVVNTDFGWHHDQATGRVELGIDTVVEGMQSIDATVELAGVSADGVTGSFEQLPQLAGFEFGIQVDKGFGQRFSVLCAERLQISQQEFASSLVRSMKAQLLELGFEPGFGISYAIDAFYRDWGEVRLAANPDRPVGLLSLMALAPPRLADTLGLSVVVNGSPVADSSFTWHGPDGPGGAPLGAFGAMINPGPAITAPSTPERSVPAPKRQNYSLEYRPIKVGDMPRHLRQQIRIRTAGQPVREGILVAVDDREVAVQQRLHGGKFTVHVPVNDIESIEVQVKVLQNSGPAGKAGTAGG